MDFFNHLYYAKKAMLMVECIDDNFDRVNKVFDTILPSLASAIDLNDITAVAEQYFEGIKALIPEETYEEWLYSDYEVYTDKHHHRKFWNEIENHGSIESFLEKFLEIFDAEDEPQNFAVALYDFNDYDIVFANEDDMNSFLCNFDVAPYTVFRIDGTTWIEEYSA